MHLSIISMPNFVSRSFQFAADNADSTDLRGFSWINLYDLGVSKMSWSFVQKMRRTSN